jgi:hypothetical protein
MKFFQPPDGVAANWCSPPCSAWKIGHLRRTPVRRYEVLQAAPVSSSFGKGNRLAPALAATALLLSATAVPARAEVPNVLNYQGKVLVGGAPFTGAGQFKFAFIGDVVATTRQAQATAVLSAGNQINSVMMTDTGLGYVTPPTVTFVPTAGGNGATAHAVVSLGRVTSIVVDNPGFGYFAAPTVQIDPPPPATPVTATLWSNDGTGTGGGEPVAAVTLPVTNGLYSVLLGDTNLAAMSALAPPVFANSNVQLRVWFNDGVAGFQHLAPDQRVASAAYALIAGSVPAQSLTSAQIAGAQVVKSLNGLKDQVTLQAGANVTLATNGNALVVSASTGPAAVLSGLPAGSTFTVTLDGLPAKLASPYRLQHLVARVANQYEYSGPLDLAGSVEISRPRTADQTWRNFFRNDMQNGGLRSLTMTLLTPTGGSVSWTGQVRLVEHRLEVDGGTTVEVLGLLPQGPTWLARTVNQPAAVTAPSTPLTATAISVNGTAWASVAVLPGARASYTEGGNLNLAEFTLRANPLSQATAFETLLSAASTRIRTSGADMFESSNTLCERYTLRLADDGLPIEEYELVFDPD